MAKIDVSTIEGYAEMTPEQKVAALESYSVPDPDYTGYVKKDVLDKAAHEAAEWKKKHNALLSEDERKQAEQDEKNEKIMKELDDLRRDKKISSYKASILGVGGFDAELADETAKALADGNMDTVFANMVKAKDASIQEYRADAMKKNQRPPVGMPAEGAIDYEKRANDALAAGDIASFIQARDEEAKAKAEESK